jgi:hypothetical protein
VYERGGEVRGGGERVGKEWEEMRERVMSGKR